MAASRANKLSKIASLLLRQCVELDACLIEEGLLKGLGRRACLGGDMWNELTRTDVELARQTLAEFRSITLRRHEDEIKQLDADEAEMDMLARLAETITEKYLNGRTHSDEPIGPTSAADENIHPEAPPEPVPPPNLDLKQNVSPNFGSPLRRLVRR